jgi:hypothetical protein
MIRMRRKPYATESLYLHTCSSYSLTSSCSSVRAWIKSPPPKAPAPSGTPLAPVPCPLSMRPTAGPPPACPACKPGPPAAARLGSEGPMPPSPAPLPPSLLLLLLWLRVSPPRCVPCCSWPWSCPAACAAALCMRDSISLSNASGVVTTRLGACCDDAVDNDAVDCTSALLLLEAPLPSMAPPLMVAPSAAGLLLTLPLLTPAPKPMLAAGSPAGLDRRLYAPSCSAKLPLLLLACCEGASVPLKNVEEEEGAEAGCDLAPVWDGAGEG